ncbi:MAG: hypothetical protein AAB278_02595, partial [Pseudomonadota bacterium]
MKQKATGRNWFWLIVLFVLGGTKAVADDSDIRTSWDGALYGYANAMTLRTDSVLNPGNRIAGLAKRTDTGEARLNFKAENDSIRLTARPVLFVRHQRGGLNATQKNESYLSQWQVRVSAAEGWNVAAGREVLNWGAAQFRSPSSPFYFDNGRSDPMRELVGMDTAKLTWTPDMSSSVTLARVVGTGRVASSADVWRNTWLLKVDQRGDSFVFGFVVAKAASSAPFYGAQGQISVDDETMLYAEIGSSEQLSELQSPSDLAQPFGVLPVSPRRN